MENNNNLIDDLTLYIISIKHKYITIAGIKYNYLLTYEGKKYELTQHRVNKFIGINNLEEDLISIRIINNKIYVNTKVCDMDLEIVILDEFKDNLKLLDRYRKSFNENKMYEKELIASLKDVIKNKIELIKHKTPYINGKLNKEFMELNLDSYTESSLKVLNYLHGYKISYSAGEIKNVNLVVGEMYLYIALNSLEKVIDVSFARSHHLERELKDVYILNKIVKRLINKRREIYGK